MIVNVYISDIAGDKMADSKKLVKSRGNKTSTILN